MGAREKEGTPRAVIVFLGELARSVATKLRHRRENRVITITGMQSCTSVKFHLIVIMQLVQTSYVLAVGKVTSFFFSCAEKLSQIFLR